MTLTPYKPLGPDEWRVINDEDTYEYARGSEAYCKKYMEWRNKRYHVLEGPDGTIYEHLYDDGESQWEPIANRSAQVSVNSETITDFSDESDEPTEVKWDKAMEMIAASTTAILDYWETPNGIAQAVAVYFDSAPSEPNKVLETAAALVSEWSDLGFGWTREEAHAWIDKVFGF